MSSSKILTAVKIILVITTVVAIIGSCSKVILEHPSTKSSVSATTQKMTTRTTTQTATEPIDENAEQTVHNYILNINSGIYHTSDCRHVHRMNEENKCEIQATPEEMERSEYSPCGTCNP